MSPNPLIAEQTSRCTAPYAGAALAPSDDSVYAAAGYELRYRSLNDEGRGYAFPCDAGGRVDLDALSERGRNSYFHARALVGRDFSMPMVRPSGLR